MRMCMLSPFNHVQLFATLWTVAHQCPLSVLQAWILSGLPCPPPGNLPDPGIKPTSLTPPALADRFFTTSTIWEALELLYDPTIPLLNIYTEKTIIERDTCTPVFTTTLLKIARTWKQPRYPSTDEWIQKLWYIYTMVYYPAIKKNTFGSILMRWMNSNLVLNQLFTAVPSCSGVSGIYFSSQGVVGVGAWQRREVETFIHGKRWKNLELRPRSRLRCRSGVAVPESGRIHSWTVCRNKAPEGPYQKREGGRGGTQKEGGGWMER